MGRLPGGARRGRAEEDREYEFTFAQPFPGFYVDHEADYDIGDCAFNAMRLAGNNVGHRFSHADAHAWREVWARAWLRRPGRDLFYAALNDVDIARFGTVQEGFRRGGRYLPGETMRRMATAITAGREVWPDDAAIGIIAVAEGVVVRIHRLGQPPILINGGAGRTVLNLFYQADAAGLNGHYVPMYPIVVQVCITFTPLLFYLSLPSPFLFIPKTFLLFLSQS